MERHIYDPNQPQGSMSLLNMRNTLRGLFQGDLMPLRPRASLILDDMEYPSDAAAQEEWAGTGVTVSYSTTKQEGNYALQAVIDVTGDRTLARSKAMDISAFSQAKIWERCSDASSAIQFYIKDSSANESYWNITTNGTIDTWQQDTLDLTTPGSNNGTDADLSDVVEFGFRGLDASATYIFDTIKVLSGLAVAVDASNVGSFYKQVYLGKQPLEIGAKASPALTAPSANPRIDILTVNTSGTLAWITGDEAASPTPKWASLTAGLMPICLVYCKVTMAKVVDYEDKDSNPNEAYIYADLRPLYGVGGQPVDETDTDTRKDKLVSNALAKDWEAKEDAANKGIASGYMGLDGSGKGAQDPKDHTHVEAEITNLEHDAVKIKTKPVDAPVAGDDGKAIVYDHANGKYKHSLLADTNTSNVIFSWSGIGNGTEATNSIFMENYGDIFGTSPTTAGRYMAIKSEAPNYKTYLRFKFVKIAGISTVNIYAFLAASNGTASMRVDIGGASNVVSTTSTTLTWATTSAIDVSGLTNGTVYDGIIQLKIDNSNYDAVCYAVTLIGS